MIRYCKIFSLLLLVLALVLSCSKSEDNNTNPVDNNRTFGDGTVYTSITWVGTEISYDSTAVKKDFSMLYFTADWCGWCRKMESETLTDANVIQIIGESYNMCWMNISSDSLVVFMDTTMIINDVKLNYTIPGTPTMVILDRKGNYLSKIVGYQDAETFAATLHSLRSNLQY